MRFRIYASGAPNTALISVARIAIRNVRANISK